MKKWQRGLFLTAACTILSAGLFVACSEDKTSEESSSSDGGNDFVAVDTIAPQIESVPSDKLGENAIEAGDVYDFQADRAALRATDESGTVEVRVVDIAEENGRSVYSASYISEYQFTQVGKYVVTLAVSDLSENVAYAQYKIEVLDTKAPILTGESEYRVALDEAYAIRFPEIGIEEYSAYRIEYTMRAANGEAQRVEADGSVLAPKIGTYTLEYTVTDEYEHSARFETSLEIYNPEARLTIVNDIGNIWATETVALPQASVERLSDYTINVYAVQGNAEQPIDDVASYVFESGGTYTIRYKAQGVYYVGGELHKEDGAQEKTITQDVQIKVEELGKIDFETHNGRKPIVSSTRADGVVTLVESEDFGDGTSLKFDWLRIGDGRGVIFEKAIPLPETYDAIRMYVQAGGTKSVMKLSDAWIADERGNRVNMETLYTETATDGAYYTLSLANNSLTNVKTIYIANSYGAGETYKDENGSIWEVGETRDFYIDNISFVVKPTLSVDESVFEAFLYEGDTLTLPKEQIGNYTDEYECEISYTLNGGERSVLKGYTLKLANGTYEFTYSVNAGGARLEKKISCTVFEKIPSIVYKKNIGVLRAGGSFEIPVAQAVFVADGTTVTTAYKHSADAEFTIGNTITTLKAGEYTIKYSANGCADVTYTFTVLEGNIYKHTFATVNDGIDGYGTAVGNSDYTASFGEGFVTLNGWWAGVKFDEALSLDGATALVIRVKGAATRSGVHFRYYGNKEYTTEEYTSDMGFTAVTITTEYTDFVVPLQAGVTTIYGFEILNQRTEVYVDEVRLWRAPTWAVDGSVFEDFLYIGDSLTLPTPTVEYQGEYTVSVAYSINGGATVAVTDSKISELVDGAYTIVYTLAADGVSLTESFSFTPIEKVPFLWVDTQDIQAYEGDTITLPVAISVNMEGATVATSYRRNDGEWIESGVIESAEVGTYTVKYAATYAGKEYTKELTVTVKEKPKFKVNGNEVGVTATQGTATVEEDGSLKLTGAWWVNAKLEGVTVPDGTTKMIIRLKANTELNVLYRFSNDGGDNGSMCFDETTGFILTTEYQTFTIDINASESLTNFGLCVCDDGSGTWRIVYIESITFA